MNGGSIRAARLKKGMSKEDLARAAGVTSQTIRKAERSGSVSEATAAKLASKLGLSFKGIVAKEK